MGTSATRKMWNIQIALQEELYTNTKYWDVQLWRKDLSKAHDWPGDLIHEEEAFDWDNQKRINLNLQYMVAKAVQVIEAGTGANSPYYQGIAFERERIIEIIENRRDYDCRCQCNCHAVPAPCASCEADNELIQIIRGEK